MGVKSLLEVSETKEELKAIFNRQSTIKKQQRVLFLMEFLSRRHKNYTEIGRFLNVSSRTIERWVSLYKSGGIQKLLKNNYAPTGQRSIKCSIAYDELANRVSSSSNTFTGYWEIKVWLKEHHDIDIPYTTLRGILKREFETKLKVSRPQHVKKTEEDEESFFQKCLND